MSRASFELGDLPDTPSYEGVKTPPRLKRPPSYSDSFYVLAHPASINSVASVRSEDVHQEDVPSGPRIYLFLIKSAIHIFLISVFETLFFFQYVSVNENSGILKTINTYYSPLIDNCSAWSNSTKEFIGTLVKDLDYSEVVQEGFLARILRDKQNQNLLGDSLIASAICFSVVLIGGGVLRWKKVPVRWWVVFTENISMVIILSIYEYIFFRYVVYNYSTLSTAELNSYILGGLYTCSVGR